MSRYIYGPRDTRFPSWTILFAAAANEISQAADAAEEEVSAAEAKVHQVEAALKASLLEQAKTGATPARMVERLRADLARGRIETTAEPVERVAEAVGFGDAENMRRAFIRVYGQPPQSIRRAIRI